MRQAMLDSFERRSYAAHNAIGSFPRHRGAECAKVVLVSQPFTAGRRVNRNRHALMIANRERVGREPSPSTTILDSQSIRTVDLGGTPHGVAKGSVR